MHLLVISHTNLCSDDEHLLHAITGWDFCAYDDDKSVTCINWVNQQLEQLVSMKKHAQKNIKATNAKNRKVTGGKDLVIPVGNLVLLRDHPERRNKIQNNKDQVYIITGHHEYKNAYWVKPLGSKVQSKQVNRLKMFDLGITEEQELERQKQEGEEEEEDKGTDLPLYKSSVARKKDFNSHPYNLRPRDRKPVNSRTVLATTHL